MIEKQTRLISQAAAGKFLPAVLKHVPTYHAFEKYERLNSFCVESQPEFVLMEGCSVGSHDDGGLFWQTALILSNPGKRWCFRGTRQKVSQIDYQVPGTFLLLDISKKHCVSGRGSDPWTALCWNPKRSVIKQSEYTADEAVTAASAAIKALFQSIVRDQNEAA